LTVGFVAALFSFACLAGAVLTQVLSNPKKEKKDKNENQ
jgi:hypothetical protein